MAYTFEPPFEAQHIKLDLFPASTLALEVFEDGGDEFLGNDTRVIVTDAHLYVFKDGSTAPNPIVIAPITSFSGSTASGYTVALEDGTVYHVIRAVNCGCGSRLRSFHPFPGVPYARMH